MPLLLFSKYAKYCHYHKIRTVENVLPLQIIQMKWNWAPEYKEKSLKNKRIFLAWRSDNIIIQLGVV